MINTLFKRDHRYHEQPYMNGMVLDRHTVIEHSDAMIYTIGKWY